MARFTSWLNRLGHLAIRTRLFIVRNITWHLKSISVFRCHVMFRTINRRVLMAKCPRTSPRSELWLKNRYFKKNSKIIFQKKETIVPSEEMKDNLTISVNIFHLQKAQLFLLFLKKIIWICFKPKAFLSQSSLLGSTGLGI